MFKSARLANEEVYFERK